MMGLFKRKRAAEAPWERAFPAEATLEDIYHCFRLILGRNPQVQDWPGHSGLAGRPLAEVVKSYLNSREFQERGLLERHMGEVRSRQMDGFTIYADAADCEVGAAVLQGAYEPHVSRVFRELLRPADHVVDVGANIGYFSLLAASLVGPNGSVLAVEPNPRNVRLLEASRRANGFAQVTVAQVAASDRIGLLALHAAHSNGTTGDLPGEAAALLAAETVPALPIDRLLDADRPIRLIKADVEGAEGLAMAGAAAAIGRHRPWVISEFCPDALRNISGISWDAYLGSFTGRGYRIHVIAELGTEDCGSDHEKVLACFARSGVDHIDLLFEPSGG